MRPVRLNERCPVISDRAELETFVSQILMNLIHGFSKQRYELQKSRADDGDFRDLFCTTSRRLSSIESVVFQPIDNYTQSIRTRSTQSHGAVYGRLWVWDGP